MSKIRSAPAERSLLTSLELLILALIDRGIATAYDLQARAGLSVGATLPALRRLEKTKLISRGEIGQRGRQQFTMTQKGRRALESWPHLLEEPVARDLDNILRTAALAIIVGDDRQRAAAYLRNAAEARKRHANERKLEATHRHEEVSEGVADIFLWMRSMGDNSRAAADHDVLTRIADVLTARSAKRHR